MRRMPFLFALIVGLLLLVPATALAAADDVPGTPLALGTTVGGTVDVATKPYDVWAVDLAYGQEVTINVQASDLLFAYLLRPSTGSVYAGGDHPAWEDTVAQSDTDVFTPHSASFAFTPADSGRYYVCLSAAYNGTTYGMSVRTTGVSVTGPQLPDIFGVPIGAGTVDGVVQKWTCKDAVYQVRLFAGKPVTASLQPVNGNYRNAYSELLLLSPSSQTVKGNAGYAVLAEDSAELDEGTASVSYTPAVNGVYFVWVNGVDDLAYRLTVSGVAEKPPWRSRVSLSASSRVVRRGRKVMLTGVLYGRARCGFPARA